MSYATITTCTHDTALLDRLRGAIAKEAYNNAALALTTNGLRVQRSGPDVVVPQLIWPIAIDNEAAYAFAIAGGNTAPGASEDVITDANIQTGVQAHWPPETI